MGKLVEGSKNLNIRLVRRLNNVKVEVVVANKIKVTYILGLETH
jgi:hypothetical protein